ncbi:MAG: hypothetical protein HPY53_12475 [Brevinematales bacterium]|nr:hypothetical protein [Brevinematales bacterium]
MKDYIFVKYRKTVNLILSIITVRDIRNAVIERITPEDGQIVDIYMINRDSMTREIKRVSISDPDFNIPESPEFSVSVELLKNVPVEVEAPLHWQAMNDELVKEVRSQVFFSFPCNADGFPVGAALFDEAGMKPGYCLF